MIFNVFQQVFTFGIAVLFAFGVAFVIDRIVVKINRKAVFILPTIFLIASIVLWLLGLFASGDGDWAALGLLLYGTFSIIAFVGSLLAGLLVWHQTKY